MKKISRTYTNTTDDHLAPSWPELATKIKNLCNRRDARHKPRRKRALLYRSTDNFLFDGHAHRYTPVHIHTAGSTYNTFGPQHEPEFEEKKVKVDTYTTSTHTHCIYIYMYPI